MCYSGKCPYESTYDGECNLPYDAALPYDALCVIEEKEIEEYERRHPIKMLVQRLRWKLDFLPCYLNPFRSDEIPF